MNSRGQALANRNPFIGPRPFRSGDRLYGRDREAADVVDLLLAERVLLLHAPSGAGKTSLLQAAVIPALENEGFDVSGPLRVNAIPVNGVKPRNRYVWSLIVGLTDGAVADSPEFADMTLVDFLAKPDAPGGHRVLVLDQFEEIVTLDPGDWDRQTEFFKDLGRALTDANLWALLSMREDYMGGLAPFAVSIPSHLRVRYRIDFLSHQAALQAMKGPAAAEGLAFDDEAARALVKDLAKVRVQLPGEQKAQKVDGPYVEPVQLQVVCTELWRQLSHTQTGPLQTISLEDVQAFGELDPALGAYYANAVAEVAAATGANERAIRDWFEHKLITEEGFRNQTQTGPSVDHADVTKVLLELTDRYLIRSDLRGATRWYELAHDRLIEPLCANNKKWRYEHLGPWEIDAEEWNRSGRAPLYLLPATRLGIAKRWVTEHDDASPLLREFLGRSEAALT